MQSNPQDSNPTTPIEEPVPSNPVQSQPVAPQPVPTAVQPEITEHTYAPYQAASHQATSEQVLQEPVIPSTPISDGEAFSISSFVLGIYAILSGNFLAAAAGLVLGLVARKRPGVNRGLNLWGIILSSVTLGFIALALIFVLFMFFLILTMIPIGLSATDFDF
ncbi:MAG TPA: hypothetical protein VLZ31_05985 [Microbacteriaceae bacterium]|nr:hypothetical protein [Microbacteriaceae bacterium]